MHRRNFLAASASMMGTSHLWAQANDRVRLAIVGLGGRGNDHLKVFSQLDKVEIGTVVDPDGNRAEKAAHWVLQNTGKRAKVESDMRRAFEDKDIDGVTIATTNHWHALSAIWAMQAGKDVYVEKPVSHNFFEGEQMVKAARKYQRIAQGGTQRRSYGMFMQLMKMLHEGVIGDIYQAKWVFPGRRDSIGFKPYENPPNWLNWDLWLGPAREQQYHGNLVHYNWHWFWDFGNGELGNNGIHLVDIARWGLNRGLPTKVYSTGGRYGVNDQAETPNTQTVTWRYPDGAEIIAELRGLYTSETMSWDFFGTKGHLNISSDKQYKLTMGRNKQPEPMAEPLAGANHYQNFTDAIRTRDRGSLLAEINETHLSTAFCHLGNIAYRLGRELTFDPAVNKFVGDADADRLLTREFRKPYVVPEITL
jgi:predicted dehydrogenase